MASGRSAARKGWKDRQRCIIIIHAAGGAFQIREIHSDFLPGFISENRRAKITFYLFHENDLLSKKLPRSYVKSGLVVKYYACILERRASCNAWEKLIPIEMARSFSHDGMVKVFFTALVCLYWLRLRFYSLEGVSPPWRCRWCWFQCTRQSGGTRQNDLCNWRPYSSALAFHIKLWKICTFGNYAI